MRPGPNIPNRLTKDRMSLGSFSVTLKVASLMLQPAVFYAVG